MASLPAPNCCSTRADGGGPPALSREREQQVLGADVVVLQPVGLGVGRGHDLPQPRRRARLAIRRGRSGSLASSARTAVATVAGSAFSFRRMSGTMPPCCSMSVSSRCSGVIFGMSFAVGQLLRAGDRFLCFLGVFLNVHDVHGSGLTAGPTG